MTTTLGADLPPLAHADVLPTRPPRSRFTRRFLRHRAAVVAVIFLIALVAVALLADHLAPYDPVHQFPNASYRPPTLQHWFGMDNVGRDILSRVITGARVSLLVGILAQGLAVALGGAIGAVAGYFGGLTDTLLMRLTDAFYAFPTLLLVILLATAFGSGSGIVGNVAIVIVAIALGTWTDIARLVRGQPLSLRQQDLIIAARSLGAPHVRIIFRHLLPNALGPVIIRAAYGVPTAILLEAVLAFIGLGVKQPTSSWGSMIQEGSEAILSAPHVVLFPSLALSITMLAFNVVGDGLRDALDPRTD